MRGSRSWFAVPDPSAHRQSCQGVALSGYLCFVGSNFTWSAGPFNHVAEVDVKSM